MSDANGTGDRHGPSHASHHKSHHGHDRHPRISKDRPPKSLAYSDGLQDKEKAGRERDSDRSIEPLDREWVYDREDKWEKYRDKDARREREKYRESNRDKDRSSGRDRDRHRRSPRDYDDDSEHGDRSGYHSSRSKSDYSKRRRYSPSLRDEQRDRSRAREQSRSITPIHLKKTKLNNWDVPPAEYPGISAKQLKASGIFPVRGTGVVEDYTRSADYNASRLYSKTAGGGYSTHHPSASSSIRSSREGGKSSPSNSNDTLNGVHTGGAGGMNASSSQAISFSRQARRLYVGNLPYDIVEDVLVDFINNTMVQWNLANRGSNPAMFAQINHDKSFAFVEFRTPEDATAAMAFDGLTFSGQSLKIRRPKDYQPPPGSLSLSQSLHVPGVVSTNVPDSNDKIFVGGLPLFLNDEQVMELLKSFGELKAFNLVRDSIHGTSKGFAFCEYADPTITDVACQGLNGMEIGDRRIVVQRASVGAGTRPGPPSLVSNLSLSNFPPSSAQTIPSCSLILMNMLTFDDIMDNSEYKDIIEDIRDECAKFGEVITISIPRAPDAQGYAGPAKVYVEFSTRESCDKALNSLAGRKFLDRTIIAAYYNHPIPSP